MCENCMRMTVNCPVEGYVPQSALKFDLKPPLILFPFAISNATILVSQAGSQERKQLKTR